MRPGHTANKIINFSLRAFCYKASGTVNGKRTSQFFYVSLTVHLSVFILTYLTNLMHKIFVLQ